MCRGENPVKHAMGRQGSLVQGLYYIPKTILTETRLT